MEKKKSKTRKKYKTRILPLANNIRRQKLANLIVENNGNMAKSMREAGYSPETARNPQNIIKTESFQELLDKVIPKELVTSKHAELLNAEVKVYRKGTLETVRNDTEAISKGLDMYYKLKGSYAPDKLVQLNLYASKDDSEILAEIDRLEAELGIKRERETVTPEVVVDML